LLKRIISGIMLTLLFGSMLFSAIMFVEGEEEKHDLEVSLKDNLKAPHHLSSGHSAALNATVVNKGNVTEYDVILQLWINDTKVFDSIAPKLSPGKTFWTAYSWTPENGIWNLTAYSPPVSGEDNVSNNVATKLVKVCNNESPIACFKYSPPPPPPGWIKDEIVTFNASCSYDPDWGKITKYCWYFNGTENYLETTNPVTTYTFTNHGQATVTLYVQDTENMSSYPTPPLTLRVYARPVPNFTVSGPPYIGYTLIFNASSSYDPDGSIVPPYTWDFGDDNFTSLSNPVITHTYANSETYTVKLNVTDNDNLNASKTRDITIGPGYPKADFMITNPKPLPGPYYVNENLTFDASISTPNGGDIISYSWDFQDGATGSGCVINHTFTEPRTYDVNLTVVDEKGLINSTTKQVKVILRVYMKVEPETTLSNPGEVLSVNITIANVEDLKSFKFKLSWPPDWLPPYNHLLQYNSTTEGDFLGPQKYPNGTLRWDRNYLTVGAGYVSINYTFRPVVPKVERSGGGTLMTIRFLVLSSGNATLDLSETRLLNSLGSLIEHSVEDGYFYTKKPVANFTYSPLPAIVNITVTFNASLSYDPDNGDIAEFFWDFGDGNTGWGLIIDHNYTDVGTFNVNLTVTDDESEKWWIVKPVTIISCRDVAVFSINPWENINRTGWILPINVTVRNEGGAFETFNVTLYYFNITGSYAIETKTITNLAPYSQTTLKFQWNVSDIKVSPIMYHVAKSNYTIRAVADMVPFEKDPGNNTKTYGPVTVTWLGDLNADGIVNQFDFWAFCGAFINYYTTHVKNPLCDFDCDCDIDQFDYWAFCGAFIDYWKAH
jgi:PKD repeat protein